MGFELAADFVVLALGDVGGPAVARHHLPAPDVESGVTRISEDFVDATHVEGMRRPSVATIFLHLPCATARVVDARCDLASASTTQRTVEDQLEQLLALRVELHPLAQLTVLVDPLHEHVTVWKVSDVFAAARGTLQASLRGESFSSGVLMVSPTRDDRAEQIAKGVR